MRKIKAVLIVGLAILVGLLVGCGPVSSLNPLFTDSDLDFDPALLGLWTEKGPDPASLRFEQAGPKVYRVTSTEWDGNDGLVNITAYEAHLVRLGGYRFLDVTPLQMTATDSRPVRSGVDDTQSRLVKICDALYVELQAAGSDESHWPAQVRLRRGHWIFRLETTGKTLKLAALDDDWVKNAIDQSEITIAHAVVDAGDKEIVITAAASDLQQMVLKHASDEKAFPETTVFRRLK